MQTYEFHGQFIVIWCLSLFYIWNSHPFIRIYSITIRFPPELFVIRYSIFTVRYMLFTKFRIWSLILCHAKCKVPKDGGQWVTNEGGGRFMGKVLSLLVIHCLRTSKWLLNWAMGLTAWSTKLAPDFWENMWPLRRCALWRDRNIAKDLRRQVKEKSFFSWICMFVSNRSIGVRKHPELRSSRTIKYHDQLFVFLTCHRRLSASLGSQGIVPVKRRQAEGSTGGWVGGPGP